MNMELYGQYPEFKEVDMTLKDLADTDIDEAIDKAERRGVKQGISQGVKQGISQGVKQGLNQGVAIGMEKVFALLEKGMSLAEAKKKLCRSVACNAST
jgi:flagellar biosynthesis/type III secretory pathway protein FliH